MVTDTEWAQKGNEWPQKSAAPRLLDFFRKQKTESADQDFLLMSQPRRSGLPDIRFSRPSVIFAAGCVVTLATLGTLAVPNGTIATVAAIMSLYGLVLHAIAARRRWEKDVERQLQKFSEYHDRLVREVAKSRGDLGALKEGLYGAAETLQAQAKKSRATSPEARMIETIITELTALGEKPRSSIVPPPEVTKVLELELAPPPLKAPPLGELERALGIDTGKFSNLTVLQMIRYAVRNDAIDIFLQPVVSLPQRKPRMFEVLARLRAGDGVHVPAAHYMALAQKENLGPAIDNLLLLRCLQMLRRTGRDDESIPYVLNITAATLNDKGFTGDLVSFLSENRTMAARLVFELSQAELDAMDGTAVSLIDGLSRLGCRFAMDGVRRRQLDIDLLKARHVRFIKLDAAWLVREGATRLGAARINRLKKHLDAAGIDLIVERIENEATLRSLLDYNIDFGQGWLFGRPDTAAVWQAAAKAA